MQSGLELKQFFIVSSQSNKGEKASCVALSKFNMFPLVTLKMDVKIKACLSELW